MASNSRRGPTFTSAPSGKRAIRGEMVLDEGTARRLRRARLRRVLMALTVVASSPASSSSTSRRPAACMTYR
jgi:hypothetical protein